jgi:uncharacterized membrane protein YhaH (DUF805 family)
MRPRDQSAPMTQKTVFISYRRDGGSGAAGRIFDLLSQRLGDATIFMDVEAIEAGVDFSEALDQQLSECDFFLAVIGPQWASAQAADGRRRLDDANDYPRRELEAALRRGIRVVPVLVDGATMPAVSELPESLRPFARRNAFTVTHNRFSRDVGELADVIMRNLGIRAIDGEDLHQRQPPPSWADVLLSFRGRLSRKRFWLFALILLLLTVAMQHLILLAVGGSYFDFFTKEAKDIPFQHNVIIQIVALPLWWSSFAITAKRLHDFNAGLGFTIGYAVLAALAIGISFLVSLMNADPTVDKAETSALEGLLAGLFVLLFVFCAAIGLVPGTPGPNRFGPEPAAPAKA